MQKIGTLGPCALVWVICGCAVLPVSALIRSPVDNKCRSYGLKGCPELVEGAMAYAEGDEALALRKLEIARAKNTPEQLKPFSEALRHIAKTGPDAAAPLARVADALLPPADAAHAPVVVSAPVANIAPRATVPRATSSAPGALTDRSLAPSDAALQLTFMALTASVDPMRLFTTTVPITPAALNCEIAGDPATCSKRQEGPIVVTDIVASPSCADRAFVLASYSDTTGFGHIWVAPAGSPGIHGARLVVRGGEWLYVGARPDDKPSKTKPTCYVTWSGFRPRLVPPAQRE